MNRKCFIAVVFILFGSLLWGQSFSNQQLLKLADLTDNEIKKVMELSRENELVKHKAAVEQNFYKAQLERLLLKSDPDMEQVEEVVRNSMEWKLTETMGDISLRVEIRKLIGEEKWVRLLRLISEFRKRNAESQ